MKEKDKKITTILATLLTFILAIFQITYSVAVGVFAKNVDWFNFISIQIVFLVISVALLFIGKDKVFSLLITKAMNITNSNTEAMGTWNLQISFTESEKEKVRTGHLRIYQGISGMKIEGGKLLEVGKDEPTLDKWIADDVEFIHFSDRKTIFYLYKIPVDGKSELDKIGLVVATKEGSSNVYKGKFEDISINSNDNSRVRSGDVVLYKE